MVLFNASTFHAFYALKNAENELDLPCGGFSKILV